MRRIFSGVSHWNFCGESHQKLSEWVGEGGKKEKCPTFQTCVWKLQYSCSSQIQEYCQDGGGKGSKEPGIPAREKPGQRPGLEESIGRDKQRKPAEEWRYHGRKKRQVKEETGGWMLLSHLEDVPPPPENNSCNTRMRAGQRAINIVVFAACLARPHAPITQPGAGNVWSPRRWERCAAHNTIDQNLSAPACSACTRMCFPFPVNVFALARGRAGKGAVYEIIYVGVGGWGGAAQLETPTKYKPACGLH